MSTGPRTCAALAVAVAAAAGACADPRAVTGVWSPIIYGADDRKEVFEYPAGGWIRRVAEASLVAIGDRGDLAPAGDGTFSLGPSARERFGLCPDERFADEPSFALCTGIALAPGLVLTAAHCPQARPLPELVVLSGYHYVAPGQLAPVGSAQLGSITEVVSRDDDLGYAWLAVDGAGLAPVQDPRPAAVEAEAPLVAINHGSGLPAKVDEGGRASLVTERWLLASLDTFGGASGGPVFDAEGGLVGIVSAGSRDYTPTAEGCLRAAHAPDDDASANEVVVRLAGAVEGLCAARAQPGLCANPEPTASGCSMTPGGPDARGAAALVMALYLGARRPRAASRRSK